MTNTPGSLIKKLEALPACICQMGDVDRLQKDLVILTVRQHFADGMGEAVQAPKQTCDSLESCKDGSTPSSPANHASDAPANPRDCPDCGLAARGGQHICGIQREISLNEVKTILFPYLDDQITTEAAQRLMSQLKPYLRTSEPVMSESATSAGSEGERNDN